MPPPIIWLRLPKFDRESSNRPSACPHCGGYILQRWGKFSKPVKDTHELEIEVYRYRCCDCHRTFRCYPEGVDRANRTRRIRQLAALSWALGVPLEEVVDIFEAFGVQLSRTTVWRDGRAMVPLLPKGRRTPMVRVISNTDSIPWQDDVRGSVLILELKRKKKVILELLYERDPLIAERLLNPFVKDLGLQLEVY